MKLPLQVIGNPAHDDGAYIADADGQEISREELVEKINKLMNANQEAPIVLSFRDLAAVNLTRARRWHKSPEGIMEWSTFEWCGAMAGEAGEACNAGKKMKRIESKMQQHGGDSGVPADMEEAKRRVLKEVGDTVIYGDLVCQRVGGALEEAVRMAFNGVSEREGFPERL